MRTKESIKLLNDKIDKLSNDLMSNTYHKLEKLEKLEKNLSNVNINVSNITPKIHDSGREYLKIEYSIDPIELNFNENGEPIYNEIFYSLNILDLINKEDMKKIQKSLNNFKKMYKNSLQK